MLGADDRATESAAAVAEAEVGSILDQLTLAAGRPRRVSPLPGGLTNRNYRVDFDTGSVMVRVFATGADLLAIDRDAEFQNSIAAAETGVGAPVLDYRADLGVLVVGWIDGRTLDDGGVAANLSGVAAACRRLHGGAPFAGDFDIFAVQHRYRRLVVERGYPVPPGYDELDASFVRLETALSARRPPRRPCHNDLLAANFIDDGSGVRIVDYEYAGNNDPAFELGNLAFECRLAPEGLVELVHHYDPGADNRLVQRVRLFGLASQYTWTLWAAIQAAASTIDFDFASWGAEKFDIARAGFADSSFEQSLQLVGR